MDTIEALGRLGQVDPPDLAVLDRTSEELLRAAADEIKAPDHAIHQSWSSQHSIVIVDPCDFSSTPQSPNRSRVRRRRVAVAAAVVTAAAVLIAVLIVPGSPIGRSPSAAAAVLTQAATSASSQPPLPVLGPDQYFYQANIEQQLCAMPLSDGAFVNYLGPDTHQNWVAANGTGTVRLVADTGGHWLTAQDQNSWEAAGSPPNECDQTSPLLPLASDLPILSLPTNPTTLGTLIAQGRINDIGQILPTAGHCTLSTTASTGLCSTAWQFDLVNNLLTSPVAVSKLGSVLYEILSHVPGVELIGTRVDALGRPGTAVEDPTSGDVIVLNPTTGVLLETQTLAMGGTTYGVTPGTVIGSVTFGAVSVVNGLGTPPQ